MTTDARITEDLAVVGRTSRLRPIELEATLRAVGAVVRPEPSERAVAAIFIARCARAWAGAGALVAVALLVAHLFVAGNDGQGLTELIWVPKLWVGMCALCVTFAAHAIGGSRAAKKLLGSLEGPRLLSAATRARSRSVTAMIAGITCFVVFFGLMQADLGSEVMMHLVIVIDKYGSHVAKLPMVLMLLPALFACVVSAIVVGRMSRFPPRLAIAGALMLATTVGAGLAFDVGPMARATGVVSVPLRAVLTATGTIGLFLTVAGIVFRIHRREDAVLGS
jgi:hypothetical protein